MLSKFGQKRLEANHSRFSAVSEAFGAVKEVKVGGLEKVYIKRFAEPAQNFSKYQAMLGAIALLPRYAIEIVIFGGMLLVVLYLMSQSSTFIGIVPIIASEYLYPINSMRAKNWINGFLLLYPPSSVSVKGQISLISKINLQPYFRLIIKPLITVKRDKLEIIQISGFKNLFFCNKKRFSSK